MRAKSIKNKARINAELSPAELKILLKKAQRDYQNSGLYIGLLEKEVEVWRSGGKVDREAWASMEKALGLGVGELEKLVGPAKGRSGTPVNPVLERVGDEGGSRPLTPVVGGFEKDEREEFLRRENELGDQLAKTVCLRSSSFFPRLLCESEVLSKVTDESSRNIGIPTIIPRETNHRPKRRINVIKRI